MAQSHVLGIKSEALAADHLRSLGYRIEQANYRVGHKEIDLIARKDDLVAFVEVKARGGAGYGHPLEAITWAKRREIASVARVWIAAHGRPALTYRFDAIAIIWRGAEPRIEHIPNAWAL